jgi:rhodanese-related sulfurtransferase
MASCQIDRSEVQRLAATGARIVDVLPRRPFRELHIAGALNVPLGELDRTTATGLARSDRPVVVYCNDYT